MKYPIVSAVITTKNEAGVIECLLKSLKKQTYKHIEILLVDNGSVDDTKLIAKKYTTHIVNAGPERSAQRNVGAGRATGDFLLFLDADMKLSPQVIGECAERMVDKTVGAVIIPEVSFGESFWAKVKAYERTFYVEDETIEAARFFRKTVFQALGGFDENITGPEDWDLSDRVRKEYCIARTTSSIYHNEGSLQLLELAKKKYYYGLKTPQYLRKKGNGRAFSPKTLFFLRKSFYKHPKKILSHPVLFSAMIVMLTVELVAGVTGFFVGFFND